MKFYKLIYLIIIISLLSCRKDEPFPGNEIDATIYVKQYKTATSISNAMVLITRGKPGSGFGTAVVDTLYTDASGKADYKKKIDDNYMYYAEAYKENYFDTRNSQVDVRPGEKNFKTTIFMYAHSYVKLHVKNVNPYNQFDLVQLQSYCLPNLYFQGLDIDTTFLYCDYAYEWWGDFELYSYSAWVTKNNQSYALPYAFVPVPHDTITIEVHF